VFELAYPVSWEAIVQPETSRYRDIIYEWGLRDDKLHINTQSGSQWDGLRHFGVMKHGVFYNNNLVSSFLAGPTSFTDPLNIDPQLVKLGIHSSSFCRNKYLSYC